MARKQRYDVRFSESGTLRVRASCAEQALKAATRKRGRLMPKPGRSTIFGLAESATPCGSDKRRSQDVQ